MMVPDEERTRKGIKFASKSTRLANRPGLRERTNQYLHEAKLNHKELKTRNDAVFRRVGTFVQNLISKIIFPKFKF
mgnify:CR=1 FL=1